MGSKARPQLKRAISDLDAHVRSDSEASSTQIPSTLPEIIYDIVPPALPGIPQVYRDEAFYAELTPASRGTLEAIEQQLNKIDQLTIFARGRALRAAKSLLVEKEGHGRWEKWLTGRRMAATTARAYIRAADWYDESATIADLPPGAVYRAAGAPDEVKRDIEQRAGKGEIVTLDVVTTLIKEFKKCQAKDPERLAKQLRKEQHKQQRQERELRKLHADYERQDACHAAAAGEFIDLLKTTLSDAEIRKILDLLHQTTITFIRKAYDPEGQ